MTFRHRPACILAAVLLAWPALAPAAGPQVSVRLGPAVQARTRELGADELEAERARLQRDVAQALAHAGSAPPSRAELVIEDIQPSRATASQLGASPGLSPFTRGLGGAAVTGEVVGADGTAHAVRYRWFPPNLESQLDVGLWGDAEDGFDHLSGLIASGRIPDDPRPWPPPHAPRAPTGTRIPS